MDPRPPAIVVTLSAALSCLAPPEPALLLDHGAGRYRLPDVVQAGARLTDLSVAIAMAPMNRPL